MDSVEITLSGKGDLDAMLAKINVNLQYNAERAVDDAAQTMAELIKATFTGRSKGFSDQTGALRASIKGGGIPGGRQGSGQAVGFVSAGDDTIGSDGKPTKEYVKLVEFPEFRKNATRNTAFLRPGVLTFARKIADVLKHYVRPDKLVGPARRATRVP